MRGSLGNCVGKLQNVYVLVIDSERKEFAHIISRARLWKKEFCQSIKKARTAYTPSAAVQAVFRFFLRFLGGSPPSRSG
jgi:hypothetical protein